MSSRLGFGLLTDFHDGDMVQREISKADFVNHVNLVILKILIQSVKEYVIAGTSSVMIIYCNNVFLPGFRESILHHLFGK
jgi:hypothetical protein